MSTKKISYQTKWNLNLIIAKDELANISVYRNTVKTRVDGFIDKWSKDESYLDNEKSLKTALDELENIKANYGIYSSEGYFRFLDRVLDQANPEKSASINKLDEISVELTNRMQFFEIKLSKISREQQEIFLNSKELTNYRHFLKNIFLHAKYILSEPEEKIMNLKSKTSGENWVQMISSILSKKTAKIKNKDGVLETKSFEELLSLISDKNKDIRESAFKKINTILNSIKDFAEHEFNSVLENKKNNDLIRGFNLPETSRHLSDDIETDLINTLVESVSSRFDISKRYYKLKASLLGVDVLKYYERNIELGGVDKKVDFDEGYNIVGGIMASLDSEFLEIYEEMFKNGKVDVFPSKGKHGGAFCISVLKKDPVFVMLNYTNQINDVMTLAHEFGHAIHSHYSMKYQNSINEDYSTATAETASTFFEDFVIEKLKEEVDDEARLTLLMQSLNDEVSTVFRQIAFYNFEIEIHKTFRADGYLSLKKIGNIFSKHMKSYMGEYVSQDKGSENWWIYVSHFRNMFYVYSYAFGQLVSKSLQNLVKEDKRSITKVKEFLKAGGSKSVSDIFSDIGININDSKFWLNGIIEIEKKLEEAENLAFKLGKLNK